jgi:hydrogenase maturation protease
MKVLIAGMGNIFHGDDGFGCEVIRELSHVQFPPEVTVRDFGTHTQDLAYALAEDYDIKILVTATNQKSEPGTVYIIEPDLERLDYMGSAETDPHAMNPIAVLQMARSIGGLDGQFYVVSCEPSFLEDDNSEIALSKPVAAAIPEAVKVVCMLAANTFTGLETDLEFEVSLRE